MNRQIPYSGFNLFSFLAGTGLRGYFVSTCSSLLYFRLPAGFGRTLCTWGDYSRSLFRQAEKGPRLCRGPLGQAPLSSTWQMPFAYEYLARQLGGCGVKPWFWRSRRVSRAQVRFRSSLTLRCRLPRPSHSKSITSPSIRALRPRWLVPVATMSARFQRVYRRHPFHDPGNLVGHIAGVVVLLDFPVNLQHNLPVQGIGVLVSSNDVGPHGSEGGPGLHLVEGVARGKHSAR